jgi:O-antigen/teichoic acid export membrane protein
MEPSIVGIPHPSIIDRIRSEGLVRTVFRGTGIALCIQVGGIGIGYLGQVLLARWIGADAFGSYTFIVVWAQSLSLLALLGFDIGVVRFIPEYLFHRDFAGIRGILRWSRTLALGLGILLSGVSILTGRLLPNETTRSPAFWIGALLIPLAALVELQTDIIRSKQKIGLAYAPQYVGQPLLFLGGAAAMLWSLHVLTELEALLALGGSYAAVILLQLWLVRREYPPEAAGLRYEIGKWTLVCVPLMLTTFFSILLLRMDTLMVGFLLDVKQVGIYAAAYKTAAMVSFALVATNAIVVPLIASCFARRDMQALQEAVRLSVLVGFGLAVTLAVSVVATSGFLLGAFGKEFLQARSALYLLIFGQLINVGAGPVVQLLIMTGHERETLRVLGASAGAHFLLCLVLIPLWGINGAAATSLISMTLWNVWLAILVVRRLGVHPSILTAIKHNVRA